MLLVDAESGRELEAHAADDLRHPASLTKIMTLYLTFGALDAGQLKLSDRLAVSVRAAAGATPSNAAAHRIRMTKLFVTRISFPAPFVAAPRAAWFC